MDNPFLQPLRIPIRPSRRVAGVLALVHAGALAAVLWSALPAWSKWPLSAGVAISLVRALRTYAWPGAGQAREVLLDRGGAWRVTDGRGVTRPAQLCRDALIHPALIALRLRTDRGVYRVLLTPDTVDADTLRRLRVRLRNFD